MRDTVESGYPILTAEIIRMVAVSWERYAEILEEKQQEDREKAERERFLPRPPHPRASARTREEWN